MRILAAAVCILMMSGCLDSNQKAEAVNDVPLPIPVATELTTWSGDCPCPAQPLAVADDLPEGSWLEVRVRWDGTRVGDFGLQVTGPDPTNLIGLRGYDARRVQVFEANAGVYNVLLNGTGTFEADARIRSALPPAQGELLPNIVTTVPVDIRIASCDQVERTEQGATRCLRLGNGVANPGYGPVQVYLSVQEGALSLGNQGHFVQQIHRADGTIRQRTVSGASFHVAHSHWHYDGLAEFSLFAVDSDTGMRGAEVAKHRKAGFCFLDWDRMVEQETKEGSGGFADDNCLIPMSANGWANGISAGWYDFYQSQLTDQYVDIPNLPDGVYEFISSADPVRSLEETDITDNTASVLIQITGNSVKVLEPRGWYHVQPEDDPAQ